MLNDSPGTSLLIPGMMLLRLYSKWLVPEQAQCGKA